MAVKDEWPAAGSPECQTLLSERLKNLASNLAFTCCLHCQLPNCLLRLAGGFRVAQLRSKDGAAALKHHGSEGRIGPTVGSPECQTLLFERLESSCKLCLYLPFCTASFQIACCVLQVAFVWLGSKGGAAGLKHYGSEGRIGPAAGSP